MLRYWNRWTEEQKQDSKEVILYSSPGPIKDTSPPASPLKPTSKILEKLVQRGRGRRFLELPDDKHDFSSRTPPPYTRHDIDNSISGSTFPSLYEQNQLHLTSYDEDSCQDDTAIQATSSFPLPSNHQLTSLSHLVRCEVVEKDQTVLFNIGSVGGQLLSTTLDDILEDRYSNFRKIEVDLTCSWNADQLPLFYSCLSATMFLLQDMAHTTSNIQSIKLGNFIGFPGSNHLWKFPFEHFTTLDEFCWNGSIASIISGDLSRPFNSLPYSTLTSLSLVGCELAASDFANIVALGSRLRFLEITSLKDVPPILFGDEEYCLSDFGLLSSSIESLTVTTWIPIYRVLQAASFPRLCRLQVQVKAESALDELDWSNFPALDTLAIHGQVSSMAEILLRKQLGQITTITYNKAFETS